VRLLPGDTPPRRLRYWLVDLPLRPIRLPVRARAWLKTAPVVLAAALWAYLVIAVYLAAAIAGLAIVLVVAMLAAHYVFGARLFW
jgi:membrane glycosyltransferase